MTMKKQLSRQTKRSRPASSTAQTDQRPSKSGSKNRIGSTLANKSNGMRHSSPAKARSEKPLRKATKPSANNNQAARNAKAASEKTSVVLPDTEKRHLIGHEEPKPMNGAGELTNGRSNRTWLDWSNVIMATNLGTTEELMRCKSPIDLWAISSRFALKSWLNLLPLTRQKQI